MFSHKEKEMGWNEQSKTTLQKKCVQMSERDTHTHTHLLSLYQAHKRPERRKVWEHAGWKIHQLVVLKIKVAERRSEKESGLTLVGIAARKFVRMCAGSSVLCACSIPLVICVSVCVHAWFLILLYVSMSCYACAIDLWRAQTLAQSRSHSLGQCNTEYHITISIYKQM